MVEHNEESWRGECVCGCGCGCVCVCVCVYSVSMLWSACLRAWKPTDWPENLACSGRVERTFWFSAGNEGMAPINNPFLLLKPLAVHVQNAGSFPAEHWQEEETCKTDVALCLQPETYRQARSDFGIVRHFEQKHNRNHRRTLALRQIWIDSIYIDPNVFSF